MPLFVVAGEPSAGNYSCTRLVETLKRKGLRVGGVVEGGFILCWLHGSLATVPYVPIPTGLVNKRNHS